MELASKPSANEPDKDLILVHTVQLKPMPKAQISRRMVSSVLRDVAFASVNSEKTRQKNFIIGERAKRVRHPLSLPILKNVWVGCTSKPQCACSQFYVKRRSGRVCIYEKPACCVRECNYEKVSLRT